MLLFPPLKLDRMTKKIALTVSIVIVMMSFPFCTNDSSQYKNQMVRLAKLVIDSMQLRNYNVLLKEEIETSVRLEPGVLTLYSMAEKNNPTHITILEIYADTGAYKSHLQTPHFIKYKMGTKDMVKSLELVGMIPIIPGMKIK
jgi:quinol monooxygenase YgiN